MNRHALLAAACVVAFLALPWLGDADEVRAHATMRLESGKRTCMVPEGGGLYLGNTSNQDSEVGLEYSGGAITTTVSGPGSTYIPPFDGFEGGVTISSDQPIVAITNQLIDGIDSMGSSSDCPIDAFSSLLFPIEKNNQPIMLENPASSPQQTTTYFYGGNGQQSTTPGQTMLPANGSTTVTARDMGGKNLQKPGTSLAFGEFSDGVHQYTGFGGGNGDAVDYVAALPFGQNSSWNYLPTPQNGEYTVDITVQNYFNSTEDPVQVQLELINPNGGVTETLTGTMLPGGLFNGSAVVSSDQPVAGIINNTANSTAFLNYAGFNNRSGRASGGGVWLSSSLADQITKKGIAFGMPSSQKSKVSVVVQNIGNKKAKVKLRMFDGDTGKKVQSGKANIAPGAIGTVAFKKKARGDNIYVDILVKGKTSVLGWLMRDYKGDVDFVKAVPR